MDESLNKNCKVEISEDSMEARIYLSTTPETGEVVNTEAFTYDNIYEFIREKGVKSGIDKDKLQTIITSKQYDRYHTIAVGLPAVNGTDGYFKYNFRTELDNKPKVLPDGSVDYHDIEIYEQVCQGALVAEYVPATSGHFGYNVRGGVLSSVPGKEQQPLKGSGFTVSEDNTQYISDLNGKVELANGQLIISNILDIHGDVDLTTGDIVFNGDVIVHGNVLTGSIIKIQGELTILGNVEGAYISADGNITLKSGMQGGGKGVVECGGELWGKFFEQTVLRVRGDLHANSMMNCDVFCESNIYVSGRHGILVGGTLACQGNIDATVVGNIAEVKTSLSAGVNEKALSEINNLEAQQKDLNERLRKHNQVFEKLNAIKNPLEINKIETMKAQVEASVKELTSQLDEVNKDLEQKLFMISTYSNARIYVRKYLYPRVSIVLNGLRYTTADTFTNVMIKDSGGEIQVVNNV